MSFFKSETKKLNNYTPGQMGVLDTMTTQTNQGLRDGVSAYSGEIAPGATGNQQAAFDGAASLGQGSRYYGDQNKSYAAGMPASNAAPTMTEARFQEMVGNPANEAWGDIARDISHRTGGTNGGGGSFASGLLRSGEDFAAQMGKVRGDLFYGDEQRARDLNFQASEAGADRGLQATQFGITGMGQNDRANLGAQSELGDQERDIYGQQNGEDFFKWQSEQGYNNPWYQNTQQVMAANPYSYVQEPSGFQKMMGGITGVIGAGKALGGAGKEVAGWFG